MVMGWEFACMFTIRKAGGFWGEELMSVGYCAERGVTGSGCEIRLVGSNIWMCICTSDVDVCLQQAEAGNRAAVNNSYSNNGPSLDHPSPIPYLDATSRGGQGTDSVIHSLTRF